MPKNEPMISKMVVEVMDETVYNWTIKLEREGKPNNFITPFTTYTGTFRQVSEIAQREVAREKEPVGRILLVRRGEA